MKKVVLDVDGVLLDFGKTYIEVAQDIYKGKLNPDHSHYDLHDLLQIEKHENDLVWDEFSRRNSFANLTPYPGVIESIKKINEDKIDVYIVTAIDACYESARLENLAKIGLKPKEIYCVGGGHASKKEVIESIAPLAFVDDRLDNLYSSQSVTHKIWVNQKHRQKIDIFHGLSMEVNSLQEWVNSNNYKNLIQNKGFKIK